jgi:hypothetical protein
MLKRMNPQAVGERHFGDAYTVERREFADGDQRVLVKHHEGWSGVEYVTVEIWCTLGKVTRRYYENDHEVATVTVPYDDWNGDVWPRHGW